MLRLYVSLSLLWPTPPPTHHSELLIDSPNLDSWNRWNMNDLQVCEKVCVKMKLCKGPLSCTLAGMIGRMCLPAPNVVSIV